jgi:ubiquinone/menaquinone biosynthesis C-methylase UbiE
MKDKMTEKMTWEATIQYIRTKPEYAYLVDKAYFEADLPLNVERFRNSEEFLETLTLLKQYQPNAKAILDIGSGNGISAISLALEGYKVITVEPDASETVGAGAIRKLKEYYKLDNLEIFEAFAEEIKFPNHNFDIVYARQCMHHAYDLGKFIAEASRVLKPKGLFITIRDHVIFDEQDKAWFLESHPLQKYYGGENAFTPQEYKNAMQKARLIIKQELKFYDSVINYFPNDKKNIETKILQETNIRIASLKKKIGFFATIPFLQAIYFDYLDKKYGKIIDEKGVAGRMYSYICVKQ